MTNDDKDSLEEMLAKIPITETRGSLLSAIGNLLRVIDISESSIMIPTLLKDKCEFDAYEMLTLAKILKASILGHEDLVKFYMQEQSNLQFDLLLAQHHQQQLQLQSTTPSLKSSSESTSSNSPQSTPQSPRNETIALIGSNNHTTTTTNLTTTTTNIISTNSTSRGSNNSSSGGGSGGSGSSGSSGRNRNNSNSNSNNSNSSNNSANSNNMLLIANNDRLQFNERAPLATISLLMQVEQLKKFIPQVTGLFESIIELYKNSVECVVPNRTI